MKIFVKARAKAKQESIKKIGENQFKVCVKEPPVQGKANGAIVKALARHFRKAPSSIIMISGVTSREKVLEIR